MKRLVIALLVSTFALVPVSGSASLIGVYFDTDGFDCTGTIPANSPATWYILAILFGPGANGITGAEFRQTGTPSGWFMTATANPAANVAIGDPLGFGANIAFPTCQTGSGGVVLLYTVSGFATSLVSTSLRIDRHTTPSNPSFLCPLLVLCDAPVYTPICVWTSSSTINGFCPCCPAVEPSTWGRVKAVYGS